MLINLRQQTQILASNLQLATSEQTKAEKDKNFSPTLSLLEESSLVHLNNLAKQMLKMSLNETAQNFEHFDVCNTLSGCFTSVLNAVLDSKSIPSMMRVAKAIPKD